MTSGRPEISPFHENHIVLSSTLVGCSIARMHGVTAFETSIFDDSHVPGYSQTWLEAPHQWEKRTKSSLSRGQAIPARVLLQSIRDLIVFVALPIYFSSLKWIHTRLNKRYKLNKIKWKRDCAFVSHARSWFASSMRSDLVEVIPQLQWGRRRK